MAGRPKKAKADVKTYMLRVRMTEEERRVLDEAARLLSLDMSSWVRSEILTQARRVIRASKSDAG